MPSLVSVPCSSTMLPCRCMLRCAWSLVFIAVKSCSVCCERRVRFLPLGDEVVGTKSTASKRPPCCAFLTGNLMGRE